MILLNSCFFIIILFNYPQFDNVVDEEQSGFVITNLFIQGFFVLYWATVYGVCSNSLFVKYPWLQRTAYNNIVKPVAECRNSIKVEEVKT